MKKILEISSGAGMQALNRRGNFRRPNKKESPAEGTLLHYYLCDGEPRQLGKDAYLEDVKGSGEDAKSEYRQWGWINEWDKEFETNGFEALTTPPNKPPDIPEPKQTISLEKLYNLLKRVGF